MNIILITITIIAIIISIICITRRITIDNKVKVENRKIYAENEALKDRRDFLQKIANDNSKEIQRLQDLVFSKQDEFDRIQKNVETAINSQKQLSREAFENYCGVLENKYKETEMDYEQDMDRLNQSYSDLQLKLIAETDEIRADLDKMRATRAAAIEASRREKEIKEHSSFYCLKLSEEDLDDVARLNRIKPSLNKPRVLSMLIWSTFYQKPLKALAINVLGTSETVCGIYKITNQETGQCYIGQARDIAKRWSEHAKCGLGIDTPASNKLYSAMIEYGLHHFSFEILEAVPADQLDQKEQFYIQLYDSVSNGYNTLKGTNLKR